MAKNDRKNQNATKIDVGDEDADMLEGSGAPVLAEDGDDMTALGKVGGGSVKSNMVSLPTLLAELTEAGIEFKHAGGSLPPIEFDPDRDKGKTIVVRWGGIERASEDADFDVIQFDVLNWQKFKETGDADASFVLKAQLLSSHALRNVFGETAKPDKGVNARPGSGTIGKVYGLTYGGSLSVAKGQRRMHLYTVTELTLSARFKRKPALTPATAAV
jgi:hypothetical protein